MSTQRIHIDYVDHDTAHETSKSSALAVLDTIALSIRQMFAKFIHERALRRAEKELMALDDRMLRDIGLTRGEIASAVRNPGEERLNGAQPPMSASF